MRQMTRRERRTWRRQRYTLDTSAGVAHLDHRASGEGSALTVAAKEAPLPGWLRHLDYRVSGESGALRVHTHSLSWHRAKCPNASLPPLGRGWDRSGPARLVGVHAPNSPSPASTTGGRGA